MPGFRMRAVMAYVRGRGLDLLVVVVVVTMVGVKWYVGLGDLINVSHLALHMEARERRR